ncbi:MAG TPA: hypothetical protein VH023_12810 [Rhodopila sp.]|nr:hypothetical protein [Rhodopila sp.]
MTEIATTQPTDETSTHPDDILLTLIVALLAPLFLTAGDGNIAFARLAALQTIGAYRARSQADLITIAQIVACGLAALGSLGLSMGDQLSVSMVLRLRGNAVALNRAADWNRKALAASRTAAPAPEPAAPPQPDLAYEATVQANVAAAQQLTAAARADLGKPAPATPTPSQSPIPSQSPRATAHREWQIMLANAMTEVAVEFSAEAASLPPEQRDLAARRADALSSAATDVILGNIPPPPRPGDLAACIPPDPPRP